MNCSSLFQGRDGFERRVLVMEGLAAALRLASERPELSIDVFERSWRDVDRAREIVEARGLRGRVHVWHRAAADVARRVMGRFRPAA